MELSASELGTIKRALVLYNLNIDKGLRNKGFFIDIDTYYEDICNLHTLLRIID